MDRKVSLAGADAVHRLKWRLQGFVGDALGLSSVTPPEIYLETMAQMIRAIADQGAVPVVLSPFVFGGQRSDRLARKCVASLQPVVAAMPAARYVNVYAALDRHPRRLMLLGDGTHLSVQGQAVAGECLAAVLAPIIRERK